MTGEYLAATRTSYDAVAAGRGLLLLAVHAAQEVRHSALAALPTQQPH